MVRNMRNPSAEPSQGSAIRLYGAMCLELSDQWRGEQKRYLNMERLQNQPVSSQGASPPGH